MNRIFYPKNLQIGQSFFASYGMHFMNYFASWGIALASGMQDAEVAKSLVRGCTSGWSSPVLNFD